MHRNPLSNIVHGVIHEEMPFKEQPPCNPHELTVQFHNSEPEHGQAAAQVNDLPKDVPQVLTSVGHALLRQWRWKHELMSHSPGWLTPWQFIQEGNDVCKGAVLLL